MGVQVLQVLLWMVISLPQEIIKRGKERGFKFSFMSCALSFYHGLLIISWLNVLLFVIMTGNAAYIP